jgi:hypothetical protein
MAKFESVPLQQLPFSASSMTLMARFMKGQHLLQIDAPLNGGKNINY